jgi:hypothetical protein
MPSLRAKEFAALVGISHQKAAEALKRCHDGVTWRGVKLDVVIEKGQRARGGLVYLVRQDSIPPAFIINAPHPVEATDVPETETSTETPALPMSAPAAPAEVSPTIPPALSRKRRHLKKSELDFKMNLVQRIRQETAPNTKERAALIEALAQSERFPYGNKRGQFVGESTLRKWVKDYEESGLGGVARKARADAGKSRVLISKAWDAVVKDLGLSEAEQQDLAKAIQRRIASEWRSGTPSWPTVQMNVLSFAIQQFREAGCTQRLEDLKPACLIPKRIIEAEKHYQAVAIYRQDAARSAAIQTPRIRRSRNHLKPMEWVAGDVHHNDVLFQREDGSVCTIKFVAWLDLATNRAFITPFVMPRGEMIRREHVIESFAALCADPNWGVPTRLYLDRGGEYNWDEFVKDLLELKHRIDIFEREDFEAHAADAGVYRSRAYNPQSKVIETLFASLERSVFAQFPGYIGGNRMKKKTENQGKAPKPYPGDFDAFQADLRTGLDSHHHKPQQGHLQGQTPNERFQEFIDAGWQSITLDPAELAVAFSKPAFREVHAGGEFIWEGAWFRHDGLIRLAGVQKVLIRQPLFGDKTRLFLFTEAEEPIGIAERVKVFPFGAVEGAGEQQRQAKLLREQIRELESDTDKLTPLASMRETVAALGREPQAETAGVISISPQYREMARMNQETPSVEDDSTRRYRDELSEILRQVANGG